MTDANLLPLFSHKTWETWVRNTSLSPKCGPVKLIFYFGKESGRKNPLWSIQTIPLIFYSDLRLCLDWIVSIFFNKNKTIKLSNICFKIFQLFCILINFWSKMFCEFNLHCGVWFLQYSIVCDITTHQEKIIPYILLPRNLKKRKGTTVIGIACCGIEKKERFIKNLLTNMTPTTSPGMRK